MDAYVAAGNPIHGNQTFIHIGAKSIGSVRRRIASVGDAIVEALPEDLLWPG